MQIKPVFMQKSNFDRLLRQPQMLVDISVMQYVSLAAAVSSYSRTKGCWIYTMVVLRCRVLHAKLVRTLGRVIPSPNQHCIVLPGVVFSSVIKQDHHTAFVRTVFTSLVSIRPPMSHDTVVILWNII